MTVSTAELVLDATGISKAYGAVVALRAASLSVRPGEVHALMGANGAGKSTFVKILTGAVRPDSGRIALRGRESSAHSPREARRLGLVSVYQEPSLLPDLDLRSNLRLTDTPVEAFTISIQPSDTRHGTLAMAWGAFRWTAPIMVR